MPLNIAEIREMYRVALTWTANDSERAVKLVQAYLRGSVDAAILETACRS